MTGAIDQLRQLSASLPPVWHGQPALRAAIRELEAAQTSRPATREQMERAGLSTPGQSECSELANACEQDEGA